RNALRGGGGRQHRRSGVQHVGRRLRQGGETAQVHLHHFAAGGACPHPRPGVRGRLAQHQRGQHLAGGVFQDDGARVGPEAWVLGRGVVQRQPLQLFQGEEEAAQLGRRGGL